MDSKAFGARLLILLNSKGLITKEQAERATSFEPELPEKLLLREEWITREVLAEVTAKSFGAEVLVGSPKALKDVLSPKLQKKYQIFPISLNEEIVVASLAPGTAQCSDAITAEVGKPVRYLVTDRITLAEHFEQLDDLLISHEDPESRSEEAREQKVMPDSCMRGPLVGWRYRRGKKLLQGRFSTLYQGRDEKTGMTVAIRHLESFDKLNEVVGGPSSEARAQTLKEGRVLARLCHPNLPRVRKVVQSEDDIYLVGDEISGRSLEEDIVENGVFEPELVRRYFLQLLKVVRYLHTQEPAIIHRDLRAETVMISSNGSLCLAEFGLAKMADSDSGTQTTSFRSAGDPHFAAPEQLMGDGSSTKNDLYSVGAIAYFMACGKKPEESLRRFSGASELDPLPSGLNPHVTKLIEKCLMPKPEERAHSAQELLLSLDLKEVRMPALLSQIPEEPEQTVEAEVQKGEAGEPIPVLQSGEPRVREASSSDQAVGHLASVKRSMFQLLFRRKKSEKLAEEPVAHLEIRESQLASFPFADLASMDVVRNVARTIPEALCRNITGICVGVLSETEITIACKDPTDVHIYDQVAIATKGRFTPTLMRADEGLIEHAIEFVYRSDHLGPETPWTKFLELKRLHDVVLETTNEQATITFGDEALEGPIVEAVDLIIKEAIAAEASDIHLEPFETGMDIRYRIDGVLRKVSHHERQVASAIVKRLKVLANMDIAQERVTQGGRISLRAGGEEYDLRVSIVPVPVGESVVMRILKKGAFTLTLADLGFSEDKEFRFRRILSQPHGMILVCGPTGSGKSTTLYASLKEIQRPDRKLLTAEDPIEYQMPGIVQVQMNTAPKEEEKKVTFSKTLREFLRQDPDVILVGEIRDQETAEIGIQAALTGHLLLSTLHTNDSIGIIARLRDMDCEPFQIGSVLLGGLAQRLARKICQNCRVQVPVPEEMLSLFAEHGIESPKMYKGRGCRKCHQSGLRGRVGLYELLEVSPEIRAHINRGDNEEKIRATAESQGFQGLLSDGLEKVCRGHVTLEEVLRVCKTF